jgi:N-methylhydantoinase A
VRNTPIDVLLWRVVATGPRPRLALPRAPRRPGASADTARKGGRRAWVPEQRVFAEVPVFDRYALAAGVALAGPAILEERESTVLLGAGAWARVDEWGNLVADVAR